MKKFLKPKFTEDGIKIPFYKRKWFIILAVLFVFTAIFYEEDKPEEVANNNPIPPIEQVADKDSEVEEVEEKEDRKKEKEKPKTLSELDPQEMLDDFGFKVNVKTSTEYFIEEYEKQKIKKVKYEAITVYSSDTIKDQSGVEFPYSFMVSGRYEEKGTGALKDFVMTLVFKDGEGLENGKAFCMQYINDDTGTYFNVMDPEDDAMLKLLELLEDN